jgi:hypothetical protein
MSRCCRSQRRRSSWATSAETSCDQCSAVLKGNHADRAFILTGQKVENDGLQLGRAVVGFAPDPTQPAEIVHHQIDIMIVATGHDRGRPVGPTHTLLHATEPGVKADTSESFLPAAGTFAGFKIH